MNPKPAWMILTAVAMFVLTVGGLARPAYAGERLTLPETWEIQPADAPDDEPVEADWVAVPAERIQRVTLPSGDLPEWTKRKRSEINSLWYRSQFEAPASWSGQRVVMDFARIEGDAIVFLNGRRVGELLRPGGLIDVTAQARTGENVVQVFVTRSYTGISRGFEQDHLRYAARQLSSVVPMEGWQVGISAPVTVEAWPRPVAISDVFPVTSWRNKAIRLEVELDASETARGIEIHADIRDANGKPALTLRSEPVTVTAGRHTVTIKADWVDPIPWQLDAGYLYELETRVLQNGRVIDSDGPTKFGFREIWTEGKDIIINGRRSPWRMNWASRVKELSLYRLAGWNVFYVQPNSSGWWRTGNWAESRYHDPEMLEYADEHGLGLTLPVPQVDHLRQRLLENPELAAAYEKELNQFIRRYRRHPSVLAWTVGMNTLNPRDAIHAQTLGQRTDYKQPQADVLRKAFELAKKCDPTRLVYSHADGNIGDISTANLYFNLAPLQEREDWLMHWHEKGDMPWAAVEFGNTFTVNYVKRRQLLFTEYFADRLGPEAYELETDEARELLITARPGQWDADRWIGPFLPGYWRVQAQNIRGVNRAWRTWGDYGHMPWDFDIGYGDPPGFDLKKDRIFERYDYIEEPLEEIPAWVNEGFWLHHETMQPLLVYIAGGEPRFTEKTYAYFSGETISKQIAFIWDGPGDRALTAQWVVRRAAREIDRPITQGIVTAELPAGTVRLEPFRFVVPEVDARTEFVIELTVFDGERQVAEDRFHLVAFPRTQPRPLQARVALWDPAGRSAWVRSLYPAVHDWQPEQGLSEVDVLIVGREAVSATRRLPFTAADVERGLRVLVLEQQPDDWEALGFQAAENSTREVFINDTQHPLTQGLTHRDLSYWRGTPDLLPEHKQARAHDVRHYPKVSNLHVVAPVVLVRPQRVGFTPILVSNFDLDYSPLLQWRFGRGTVMLCTLSLTDRVGEAPVPTRLAQGLLEYLQAPMPEARHAVYFGDPQAARMLGLDVPGANGSPDRAVWVIGPDAEGPESRRVEAFVESGGVAVYLQRPAKELAARGYAVESRTVQQVDFEQSALSAAVGPNLTRWRDPLQVVAFKATGQPAGARVLGEGVALVHERGEGRLVYLQVGPEMLATRYSDEPVQRERVQLSVARLRQLVAQIITANGAGVSDAVAQRLTTPIAGASFAWLRHWHVLGPIAVGTRQSADQLMETPFPGEQAALEGDLNPNHVFQQADGSNLDFRATAIARDDGFVDLIPAVGGGEGHLAYATTIVESPEARTATLRLGFDYWARVYLNGKPVYQSSGGPGSPAANRHRVKVQLNEGENVLTLKVIAGSKGFGFWANLSEPGADVEDMKQLERELPTLYEPLEFPFDPYEYHYW